MKTNLRVIAGLSSLAVVWSCAPVHQGGDDPWTAAPYVFAGTVVELGGSTVDLAPPSGGTATVKVDAVLFQKGVFADLTGDEITVLTGDRKLERGRGYVFYTEPLLFGDSVAVDLIEARQDDRPDPTAVREAHERQELSRELKRVKLVIVGTIKNIEPFRQQRELESEHSPDLYIASLGVERVLKGDLSGGGEVEFLFAASRDVHWYRAPKVEVGDAAVFLLEAGGEKAGSLGIGPERLTLFEPLHLQPLDRLELIEELMK